MLLQLGNLGHLTAVEVGLPNQHQMDSWTLLGSTGYNTGTGRVEAVHFEGGRWRERSTLGSDSIELTTLLNDRLPPDAAMRIYHHLIDQQVVEAQAALANARTAVHQAAAEEVWARCYKAATTHPNPRVHDVAMSLLPTCNGTPEELLAAAEDIAS